MDGAAKLYLASLDNDSLRINIIAINGSERFLIVLVEETLLCQRTGYFIVDKLQKRSVALVDSGRDSVSVSQVIDTHDKTGIGFYPRQNLRVVG